MGWLGRLRDWASGGCITELLISFSVVDDMSQNSHRAFRLRFNLRRGDAAFIARRCRVPPDLAKLAASPRPESPSLSGPHSAFVRLPVLPIGNVAGRLWACRAARGLLKQTRY